MSKHKATQEIIDIAYTILADDHPMTVRQVYYQLVARQIIRNQDSQYKRVSRILVDARKDGANLKKNGALRFGRVGPLAPARLVCIIGE